MSPLAERLRPGRHCSGDITIKQSALYYDDIAALARFQSA